MVMTKEEFLNGYSQWSNIPRKYLLKDMVALPCACGDDECQGWAMVRNDPEMIAIHMELYAPERSNGDAE